MSAPVRAGAATSAHTVLSIVRLNATRTSDTAAAVGELVPATAREGAWPSTMPPGVLDESTDVAPPQVDDSVAARLLIEEPDRPAWSVELLRGVESRVGRTRDAAIRLEDRRVSRAHATLAFDGRAVVVRDLASANGTFVGIERVRGSRSVGDGATLAIGSFDCVVRVKLTGLPQPIGEPSVMPGRELVCADPLIVELFSLVRRLAAIDLPVVVEGEAGVGKELVARMLHRHSPRAERPFVSVDCAALAGPFAAEVLFGREGFEASGAPMVRPGVFEEAVGGTVMLGDVDELSAPMQDLLLNLLRDRTIVRVGSIRPTRVDVRVVAATRRDLALAVSRGRFRQDLYALLKRASLLVPPLRARPGDIPPLVDRVLRFRGASCAVSPDAMAALLGHPWPGNVRELHRVMEGALAAAGGATVGVEHLRLRPSRGREPLAVDPRRISTHPARSAETERRVVAVALDVTHGNRSGAARALGISRRCLLARMERYGAAPGPDAGDDT